MALFAFWRLKIAKLAHWVLKTNCGYPIPRLVEFELLLDPKRILYFFSIFAIFFIGHYPNLQNYVKKLNILPGQPPIKFFF